MNMQNSHLIKNSACKISNRITVSHKENEFILNAFTEFNKVLYWKFLSPGKGILATPYVNPEVNPLRGFLFNQNDLQL